MSEPRHPWTTLLRQLTQAMSADGSPVLHSFGPQAASAPSAADRVEWTNPRVGTVKRNFRLTEDVCQVDQAVTFEVTIHGTSFMRALDLHALLVAWLDELTGPTLGGAPSPDAVDPLLLGSVNLAALSYPYVGVEGLTLDFTAPMRRVLTFPLSTIASPSAFIPLLQGLAAAAGMVNDGTVLFRIAAVSATESYLEIRGITDPLSGVASSLTLDPTVVGSACAALGFVASVNASSTGTAPTTPYKPGYRVGDASKPCAGGTVSAGAWSLTVPVTLLRPAVAKHWLPGMIQSTPLTTRTADADGSNAEIATVTP